jgi:hypothetical protein
MEWKAVQFWGVVFVLVGLGLYALYNTRYFFWFATAPLLHADLRKDYVLRSRVGAARQFIIEPARDGSCDCAVRNPS